MRTPDLASIVSDYRALRTEAGVVDLLTWTSLRVTGPDARSFLQGLATQDLAETAFAPSAAPTLFLSERGRPVALAWVTFDPRDGAALVVADDGARATLRAHFDRFHVMEDVEIEGPRDARIFGFAGPARRDLLRRFAVAAATDGLETLETLESEPLSFVLIPSAAPVPPGFDPVSPEAFEAWRVSVGLPRTGIDLDPDRIATELSLEEAISHSKGCFVGQEVVARTSNRGQVKRRRVGFRFEADGAPLAPRTEIRAGGAPAGYVTASALEPGTGDGLGMGYLALEAQVEGASPVALRDGYEVPIRPAVWPL